MGPDTYPRFADLEGLVALAHTVVEGLLEILICLCFTRTKADRRILAMK